MKSGMAKSNRLFENNNDKIIMNNKINVSAIYRHVCWDPLTNFTAARLVWRLLENYMPATVELQC